MSDKKPILAIETSSVLCGASLYYSENEYYESIVNLKNTHSEKIYQVIDNVMANGKISFNNLFAVAVSIGPGSFTGLRIGLSAAKGIAFGASIPIIAVPTFEALALQIKDFYIPSKENEEFVIVMKVKSEEVYVSKFQFNNKLENKIEIINKNHLKEFCGNSPVFGKFDNIEGINHKVISSPSPKYIALWSDFFGKDSLFLDYDYLEPNYIKDFIIPGVKK